MMELTDFQCGMLGCIELAFILPLVALMWRSCGPVFGPHAPGECVNLITGKAV